MSENDFFSSRWDQDGNWKCFENQDKNKNFLLQTNFFRVIIYNSSHFFSVQCGRILYEFEIVPYKIYWWSLTLCSKFEIMRIPKSLARLAYVSQNLSWIMQDLQERIPCIKCDHIVLPYVPRWKMILNIKTTLH
jgi:hypothetical protein